MQVLMAVASSVGIIHSPVLDPFQANQLFPCMYLLAAALLLLCHTVQNRSEQVREMEVRWAQRLVALASRFPKPLAPVRHHIDRIAQRFGLSAGAGRRPSREEYPAGAGSSDDLRRLGTGGAAVVSPSATGYVASTAISK